MLRVPVKTVFYREGVLPFGFLRLAHKHTSPFTEFISLLSISILTLFIEFTNNEIALLLKYFINQICNTLRGPYVCSSTLMRFDHNLLCVRKQIIGGKTGISKSRRFFGLEHYFVASSNFMDLEGACHWASDTRESHQSPGSKRALAAGAGGVLSWRPASPLPFLPCAPPARRPPTAHSAAWTE